MFGTLGGPELFLILVVALIVFGPRKLPEIGKSVGRMMAEFRKASNDFRRTIEDEVEAEKLREATRIDTPSWTSPAPATAEPAALPPASEGPPAETAPAEGSTVPSEAAPFGSPEAPPADTVSRDAAPGETK
jgi:Tat protein translocase TatB subunit